jgi:hypothetical protein
VYLDHDLSLSLFVEPEVVEQVLKMLTMNVHLELLIDGLRLGVDYSTRARILVIIASQYKSIRTFVIILKYLLVPVYRNNMTGHRFTLVEILPPGNVKQTTLLDIGISYCNELSYIVESILLHGLLNNWLIKNAVEIKVGGWISAFCGLVIMQNYSWSIVACLLNIDYGNFIFSKLKCLTRIVQPVLLPSLFKLLIIFFLEVIVRIVRMLHSSVQRFMLGSPIQKHVQPDSRNIERLMEAVVGMTVDLF